MAQQARKKILVARSASAAATTTALTIQQTAFVLQSPLQFRPKRFFCRLRAASCELRPARRR